MLNVEYKRTCPECLRDIVYTSLDSLRHSKSTSKCRWCCNVLRGKTSNRRGCHHKESSKHLISLSQKGVRRSMTTRIKMSRGQKRRYSNPIELQKMADAVKLAMHRPDVRQKHMRALHRSNWLKVKADVGQMELLSKWNRIGFRFEPNYQVHTDSDLFYVDGYDSKCGVVLEYDSKYHKSIGQQEKDRVREKKIIDALQPRKFWRYDSETKIMSNVLEKA